MWQRRGRLSDRIPHPSYKLHSSRRWLIQHSPSQQQQQQQQRDTCSLALMHYSQYCIGERAYSTCIQLAHTGSKALSPWWQTCCRHFETPSLRIGYYSSLTLKRFKFIYWKSYESYDAPVHQIFSICRGPQGVATGKILGECLEGIVRGCGRRKNCPLIPLQLRELGHWFLPLHAMAMERSCRRMTSVRPSFRPSVTLMDPDHVRWARWNFITRLISRLSSLAVRKISAI